jgi:hypothetical protein
MIKDRAAWDPAAIQVLMDGLGSIDWQQLELLVRIPLKKRVLAATQPTRLRGITIPR